MINVFLNTYRLKLNSSNNQLEDFLSEIFASCLQHYPELLNELLLKLGLPVLEEGSYKVKTQFRFRKLGHHETDSIPDIVITLPDKSVLIIESKVDATEGTDQLKRYAEQIKAKFDKGTLLYLTKNYDPKTENLSWDKDLLDSVDFKQCRWFDIYQLASKYKHHLLINQMLEFMTHTNISSDNKFSPGDIIALNNFSRVKKIMDETMQGEVLTELIKVAPQDVKNSKPITQLEHQDRYNYVHYQKNHVWVGLGYWMNSANQDEEYPDLKFVVEVSPKSPVYEEVIKIMSRVVDENPETWHGKNLNNVRDWAQVYQRKSLKDFLAEENHVEAIRQHFLAAISNYATIKEEYFGDMV